eukprot:CAMPEP_0184990106 /NCGR_PEP_ID=MMETSP1098-20130426/30980_1 /TAXON_ID=89044 /ORGANISM="Spumella elongata, Strain CCAP 955/1" /LENGTH=290 /DNA_ID=CAMNT_0027515241 /DNA_START=34 /DNA_END=903 /DNA_ORIENTATION=-
MIVATLAEATSGVTASIRKSSKAELDARGTASPDGLFKLLNIYLHWIRFDQQMSEEDKNKISRCFGETIDDLITRYKAFSSSAFDQSLEEELADCLYNLLNQYNRYKSVNKVQQIALKRNFYDNLVMVDGDAELEQLGAADAPARAAFNTAIEVSKVKETQIQTGKRTLMRPYRLQSCDRTLKYVRENLVEPELSFVLSPPVMEWLADLRDSYNEAVNNPKYSAPKMDKGVFTDVEKLLLELELWQRHVDEFASTVMDHQRDSAERNRLLALASSRQRDAESLEPSLSLW